MRKTLVLLDCDGPMANFVNGFLDVIEEETGMSFGAAVVTEWEITESPFFAKIAEDLGWDPKDLSKRVWKRVNDIGFCSSLKPVPGLREALERLRALDVDVECITSPLVSSPTWMPERFEWLRRFGFKKDQVHFVNAKHRVPGDFLVDDKPSHIDSWINASQSSGWEARGMLWNAPYNDKVQADRLNHSRVRDWKHVVDLVTEFKKANERRPDAASSNG